MAVDVRAVLLRNFHVARVAARPARNTLSDAGLPGWPSFMLEEMRELWHWLRRSIEFNRNYSTAHWFLAAGLA
jgi:hypothetical protein